MSNKSKHNSSILLEVIISIIFFSNLNSYNAINLLLAESRITIKLKSSGKQNIINYDLIRVGGQYPDEIHIKNGATYRIMNYTSYIINLQPNENTLIMVWNIYTANNTRNMFRGCINITEINLTEFNIDSKILSTGMMFYNCISLTSVIFGKFGGPDLRWIDQLFSYCSSLVYVDLSNFDTSGVTMMNFVFKGCSNLKSINLSNFDTSKVQNMSYMFADCYSLESLNLSNFITSNVKDMSRMFLNCKNLTNINLSGFDTSNLIYMPSLFFGCINLTYINISNFNTSQLRGIDSSFKNCSSLISVDLPIFKSVLYADNMFAGCVSLTSLNLKNLYIDNVNKPIHMFEDCYKLKYINLENFKENNKINNDTTKDMFKNIPENVVICINETINPIISGLIKEIKCSTIFCGDNWLEKQKVIGQNGQCKERCDNDSEFLYDGKCYNDCLKGDYNNINIIERNCKCPLDLDLYKYCPSAPEGYYLNKSDLYYKSCYISCEKCDIGGEENNHNCIECKQNYSYEMNLNDYKNCYDICPYYFYYDKNSSKNICTENSTCPEEYNKYINETNQCISKCVENSNYPYEFRNNCYKECPPGSLKPDNTSINKYYCKAICPQEFPFEIFSTQKCEKYCAIKDLNEKKCILNYKGNKTTEEINEEENNEAIDLMLNNVDLDITSKDFNTSNIEKGYDINYKYDKMTITITTPANQKNKTNNNITTINIDKCEPLLRQEYNISDNETLYIKKIDVIQEGIKIPKIEYDIYTRINGTNLQKLNLSICKGTNINLYIPIKITEDLDKLNISSGYYNDICYKTTTEKGTDIILEDRQKEFINNNKTVCQEDCIFSKYDDINEKAECSCKVKEASKSILDMKINKTKLLQNCIDINNIANIKLIYCYNQLFTKDGIINNIAFYSVFPIIVFHLITIIIFYSCQKILIDKKIKDIFFGINNWDLIEEEENKKKKLIKMKKLKKKKKGKKKMIITDNDKKIENVKKKNSIIQNNDKNDNKKNEGKQIIPIINNNFNLIKINNENNYPIKYKKN